MYTGPQCKVGQPGRVEDSLGQFRMHYADFYAHPEQYAVEPFCIYGNLYYVGDRKVCMHLVDTGDGLLLIDCGYGNTTHMIEQSIEKLGFDCHDLRWIFVTHGHFDHFGSGDALRNKYGCQIYMSKTDTLSLQENPARALIELGPYPDAPLCTPDKTVEDGEILHFGPLAVRCEPAPGHTVGVMALFFQIGDRIAATWGGVGLSGLYGSERRRLGQAPCAAQVMLETVRKLRNEKVDINLGNHPVQNCTLEKRQWMLEHPGENPFLDSTAWGAMLDVIEASVLKFIELGYDN